MDTITHDDIDGQDQMLGYLDDMMADPDLLGWALVLLTSLPARSHPLASLATRISELPATLTVASVAAQGVVA